MRPTYTLTARLSIALALGLTAALLGLAPPSHAYIEAPHSFGQVVAQSSNILVMQVEKVDRERNLIIYRKVRDVKGVHPGELIKHNIGKAGFHPREWQTVMAWAEVGKQAIFFYNGGAGEVYIDNYWYQMNAGGEWWTMTHAEPFLLRTYAGRVDRLPGLVKDVMDGKEVLVPCMVDGNKDDLHLRRAKIQRLKASLKLQTYDQKRDFAGWGGEDLRRLNGIPGFTHLGQLGRADPGAGAVAVLDFDGDGKLDMVLNGSRLLLLQNGGEAYSEVSLPGSLGSVRGSAWADYNGDGKPDCLVATATGLRLFTNLGGGAFRDDSNLLPTEPAYDVTAVAWMDFDRDGRPDILLANGYHGLRLYRNDPPANADKLLAAPKIGPWYLVGPFNNQGNQGFEREYGPELQPFNPDAKFAGRGSREYGWRKMDFADGMVHSFIPHIEPKYHNDSLVYLCREIECQSPTELPISLGSDDTLTVYVNGKKVLAENVQRPAQPDQNKLTISLKPGRNHLVLKIGNGGGEWGFYYAAGPARVNPIGFFKDISESVGLGENGHAALARGDSLTVADLNGDGLPDFVYGADQGLVLMHTGKGFALRQDCGLRFRPRQTAPVFADFDGDGKLDAFVPQSGARSLLFRGDGQGRFTEVTDAAGDLATLVGLATSAAWGDVDGDGRPDLVVGMLREPNRYYRNLGGGRFADETDKLGLGMRIFNSQGVALADVNGNGTLDLILNNEGQDAVLLLGNPELHAQARPALTVVYRGAGACGARVRVVDQQGQVQAVQYLGHGGRGQQLDTARFALNPGTYRVEVSDSAGQTHTQAVTLGTSPQRVIVSR
jgi:hypothetical protein